MIIPLPKAISAERWQFSGVRMTDNSEKTAGMDITPELSRTELNVEE